MVGAPVRRNKGDDAKRLWTWSGRGTASNPIVADKELDVREVRWTLLLASSRESRVVVALEGAHHLGLREPVSVPSVGQGAPCALAVGRRTTTAM